MSTIDSYQHLQESARAWINASDDERIFRIREGTRVKYSRYKEVMSRLDELLKYPRITRMPNMLLVAPSFNGKTSILEHFMEEHPPDLDPGLAVARCPVIMVESPRKPNVSDLYSRILDRLMVPYKPSASAQEKNTQVKFYFSRLGVKMLILDEIHNLIAGSLNLQREFRNELKGLGNETKVAMVAAGIEDAYNAFNTDPQLSSRFTPEELPLWKPGAELAKLLGTIEMRTPLKKASNLKAPETAQEIYYRSEGALGDICDLVKELAIEAIRDKSEKITVQSIKSISWVPPSKRKQHKHV
jgi:hypothetical protein